MFKTNYEDSNEYTPLPPGEYEAIIENMEERTTQSGAKGLHMTLKIREDVDQKCKNRKVFHTLWRRKVPTAADEQVQGYSFKQIMMLAKAVRLPNGQEYETVLDLCQDLLGRPVRIVTDIDTWNGKKREIVKFFNPSQAQRQQKNQAAAANSVSEAVIGDLSDFETILDDEEVPF